LDADAPLAAIGDDDAFSLRHVFVSPFKAL
jgi:hypothetical protein